MKHRFVYWMAAGLALAAAQQTAMSAGPINPPVGRVEIVVDGTARRQYAHEGRMYVEALKGRPYAIRLRNPYPVRVGVALSVDGLNTIDARETTAAGARKWVLEPYETVTISGWQTSQTVARRFEFTTEARSYGQALGKTANLGVISAVFFKERVRTPIVESTTDNSKRPAAPAPAAMPREREAVGAAAPGNASESKAADSRAAQSQAKDEYAATGMGQRTDHAVTQVWLDLEETPARTVSIRYEFRAQLVKLGVLAQPPAADPLQRRESARGFAPDFCPEP